CPNDCARTFIDARTPDGGTSRYISGFSCEKGTVESPEALKALTARRKDLRLKFPNLVDYESKVLFRSFYTPAPVPGAGTIIDDVAVRTRWFGGVKKRPVRRPFARSSAAAQDRRRRVQVGIPRVLNIYSTAPIWRTYFETLGIKSEHIVFSDYTTE